MEQKFVLPSDCFVWRKGEDILVYNAATKAHVEAKVTDARIGEFCDHMDDLSKLNTDILDEADQANAPFTAFIDSLVAAGCGRVCPGDAWVFSLPARPFVNHNVEITENHLISGQLYQIKQYIIKLFPAVIKKPALILLNTSSKEFIRISECSIHGRLVFSIRHKLMYRKLVIDNIYRNSILSA